jgi:hypothetical protein
VMGSCEYGDEPSGSGATDLVSWFVPRFVFWSVGWMVCLFLSKNVSPSNPLTGGGRYVKF